MKTLVFCTSYASSTQAWEDRQRIWIDALRSSGLFFDQLLIVDDGSPVLPEWPDVTVVRQNEVASPENLVSDADVVIYTHDRQLGRQSVFEFPGWYRSFAFGVLYGAAHGYEKIIHIESDAFLISDRLISHFNKFTKGWFSVWCEAYQFPEIAIQAAAGDEIANMVAFVSKPYAHLAGQIHEFLFPFTHIERRFIGNRYGEMFAHVPMQADFSAQTLTGRADEFYWWLSKERRSLHNQKNSSRRRLQNLRAPFRMDVLEGGWSGPEDGYNWMLNLDSSLFLAASCESGEFEIELDVFPCCYQDRRSQRLYILLNEYLINVVSVMRLSTIVSCVPPGVLQSRQQNHLRLIHPDAFAPSSIGPHTENRLLSLAVAGCDLYVRTPTSNASA